MRCAIVLIALACGAMAGPVEDGALEEFAAGNRKFAASVYKEILKEEPGNFIYSPLSAEVVLALTNEGAKGPTSEELIVGLSLPSTKEKTQRALKAFLPQLKRSDGDLKLLSANKIYVADGVKLEESFKTIARDIYEAGAETVNFAQKVEASKKINSWVEENTNDKIHNLITPDNIGPDTVMVLVNALYFNGKWATKFEEYETRKKKFYKTETETNDVDTMHQVENLNYYENPTLDAKFLEIPYQGNNISMVIVLPNKKEGLSSVEKNIEQALQPQPFTKERVDVELPKFTMDTKIAFVPILQTLGINKLFAGADLSGLSSTDKNLVVSDVIQKAFINVTESGTEAAAATAVLYNKAGKVKLLPGPINFYADRPFLYFIKLDETVLFVGRLLIPSIS